MKRKIRFLFLHASVYLAVFFKWMLLAAIIGCLSGLVGAAFHFCTEYAAEFRTEHDWILFCLPVFGLIIIFLYGLCKLQNDRGTNVILDAVHSPSKVSPFLAPLIFVGSVLTHLGGGSAGREGAALQIGGSLAATVGKALKLNKRDLHLLTLCGMSAVFAALFGTPLTATVFSLEVVSIGIMYYSALVPCIIASVIAFSITNEGFHFPPTAFTIPEFTDVTVLSLFQTIVLAALCAVVSILFCRAIGLSAHLFQTRLKNEYLRIFTGGCMVVAITLLLGTRDYNGVGMNLIDAAVSGARVHPEAFLIKMILTAITIGCGFKGGEIVPCLFVGASFGSMIGSLLGMNSGLGAAVGMISLFCGCVNCPIASIFLSIELFGSDHLILFGVTCAVSYMLSGYYGLYSGQTFNYSKLRAKFLSARPNAHH